MTVRKYLKLEISISSFKYFRTVNIKQKMTLNQNTAPDWPCFRTGFLLPVQPAKINSKIDFCRLKIQFVEFDFSNMIFQNPSTDQQEDRLPFNRVYFFPLLTFRLYNLLTAYPHTVFLTAQSRVNNEISWLPVFKVIKFKYSEKATKFCEISTNYLSYVQATLPIVNA